MSGNPLGGEGDWKASEGLAWGRTDVHRMSGGHPGWEGAVAQQRPRVQGLTERSWSVCTAVLGVGSV